LGHEILADLPASIAEKDMSPPHAPVLQQLLVDPFYLLCPDAPNAKLICASVHPGALDSTLSGFSSVDVAGCDLDDSVAMARCCGEAAEYLSQLSPPDDPRRGSGNGLPSARAGDDSSLIAATALATGQRVGLSEELCLRRLDEKTAPAVGTGCSAGRTLAEAIEGGFWEVIERHAVACWWHGGAQPRRLGDDLEAAARLYLQALRGKAHGRSTSLIDVSTRVGLPTIVAYSLAEDGRGVVMSFAAHGNPLTAMHKALRELVQMEAGLRLVEYKSERGMLLNEAEQRMVRRATQLTGREPCFADLGPAAEHLSAPMNFAALGMPAFAVDLTTPRVGLPVAKVVVPGLEAIPDEDLWVAQDPQNRVALL
jgi:ribosomal protein S12 methylthiotransferase accessory factor YcaO